MRESTAFTVVVLSIALLSPLALIWALTRKIIRNASEIIVTSRIVLGKAVEHEFQVNVRGAEPEAEQAASQQAVPAQPPQPQIDGEVVMDP